jgi:hypothetical protein
MTTVLRWGLSCWAFVMAFVVAMMLVSLLHHPDVTVRWIFGVLLGLTAYGWLTLIVARFIGMSNEEQERSRKRQ